MKYKVGVLQMSSTDNMHQNLQYIETQISHANVRAIKTLLLPENFALMPKSSSELYVENPDGEVQQFLSALAKKYSINIIVGSLPVIVSGSEKPYAQCLVYNANGVCVERYNKRHLYDVQLDNGECYSESHSYQAGSEQGGITTLDGIRFGLSICYDVRFSDMYCQMSKRGVDVICVPSAFTYSTGKAHWKSLLRARAIENQAFVMAAAQTGTHANRRSTWGHSMLIGPWGHVLSIKKKKIGLIEAELDLAELARIRKQFPVLTHMLNEQEK